MNGKMPMAPGGGPPPQAGNPPAGDQGPKTFYIPAQPGVDVGDTLTVKIVSMDKKNGDLEVQVAQRGEPAKESYEPEEPPADAFS